MALLMEGYAEISDYDNEFSPYTWATYVHVNNIRVTNCTPISVHRRNIINSHIQPKKTISLDILFDNQSLLICHAM